MPVIEVFADVRCPFTHVGLRRLVERRQALGLSFDLRIRAWPLELVNGRPLEADLIAEEVEALREQVAPDLFARFSAEAFPSTSLPAFALTDAGYDHDVRTGERVAMALRHAFFEEGRDIADPDVLRAVGAECDVSTDPAAAGTDQVLDDWNEGRRRGVIGSPHFFLGDAGYFCPVLDITHEGDRLRVRENRAALDALTSALSGGTP